MSEWSILNGLCRCIFVVLRVSGFNGLHYAPGPFLLWQTTVCHNNSINILSTRATWHCSWLLKALPPNSIQWNLWIKDKLGARLLSVVERLSFIAPPKNHSTRSLKGCGFWFVELHTTLNGCGFRFVCYLHGGNNFELKQTWLYGVQRLSASRRLVKY